MAEVAPEAANVAAFIAKHLTEGTKAQRAIKQHEIAEAISEIELQTQTKGSSFIKIHFIDEQWDLITSGLFDRNPEGLLPELQVEFPQHSGWTWILVACEPSNELSQPNFVCTFEDSIVRKLKNKWGVRRAKPGFNTRAEFIKELCIEAGVKFRIPSVEGAQEKLNKELTVVKDALREAEAIADTVKAGQEAGNATLTPEGEAAVRAHGLKTPGVGAGSNIKIKGAKPTSTQVELINEVMGIANSLKAGQLATEALIEACITENDFTNGSTGLLQLIPSTARKLGVDPLNVSQTVTAFLSKTQGHAQGGAVGYARAHRTAAAFEVAQAVQASGAGAASNGAANYGVHATEARAIIAAYGGIKATGGGGSPATSKQGEVARGTSQNPSEDSWDCIQRLAGTVNFSAFTNGRTFFYMDGPELAEQKPAAFVYPKPAVNKIIKENAQGHKVTETGVIQVPLNATFDNTSVEYFEDRKVRGKVQKRSRIGRPQSPSEIRMNLVCGVKEYAAGEVMEIIEGGPLNGRWIIVDATRNCFKDLFTQFLLEPPSAPISENEEGTPEEEHATPISPSGSSTGSQGIAAQALKAWEEHGKYQYTEAIPARENNGTLYGPAPRTMDCSSFALLCCKEAGVEDPSGARYHPIGNTGSMIRGLEKIGGPEAGCFAFFGNSEAETKHVVVCVGNGEAVGMETYGVNMLKGAIADLGKGAGSLLGYWRAK